MKGVGRILVSALSVVMILLVVAGQIVQYHHHDENDEICLCLHPSTHCHDSSHDDCNHHKDAKDCSLHFEDSIVVDANDHNFALGAIFAVVQDNLYVAPVDDGCTVNWPEPVMTQYASGFTVCRSLRAPPVC